MRSTILSTAARYLLPLLLVFSIFLLLRGHNDPGGGFVSGLVAASAFALYTLAFGVDAARDILRFPPRIFIATGLLIAMISGVVPSFLNSDYPFLKGIWTEFAVPAIGKLGTPFFFDIGVDLVVFGVVITIVFTLFEDANST